MAQQHRARISDDRLVIHDIARTDTAPSFESDVRRGLSAHPKHLFPKYFYDELGSRLFEAICLLPEYYLTRAENEIFERYAREIASAIDGHKRLLEMGSGSASKTRLIIGALLERQNDLLYIPVDISASALETSSRVLLQSYPGLRIKAYASEYYDALAALAREPKQRTLALFLGSNIGNFDADEARRFLLALRDVLQTGDALLLGADLKKEKHLLEAAYDDALRVTAAFNLNLLARINREMDADFNLRAFAHRAVYDEEKGRINVYIESLSEQSVLIRKLDMNVRFSAGERVHTENSHKYDMEGLKELAGATGFELARTWLDQHERFSSNLFIAA